MLSLQELIDLLLKIEKKLRKTRNNLKNFEPSRFAYKQNFIDPSKFGYESFLVSEQKEEKKIINVKY